MKKALSFIIALILTVSAVPFTVFADEPTVLTVSENGSDYACISWNSGGTYYDGAIIEKSTDGENWSEYSESYGGNDYYVNLQPKTVDYYRVKCYTEDWDGGGNYINNYAEPSNTVKVYSKIYSSYSYSTTAQNNAVINWSIDKENKKYADGFDIFYSINNGVEKSATVSVDAYSGKTSYDFQYQYKVKFTKRYAYGISYIVKPYFIFSGEKYYINSSEDKSKDTYVSDNISKLVTKRKKIIVKLQSDIPKYRIKYTRYNLKTGKSGKTKKVTTTKDSYTIKTDTKTYGYYVEVIPVISGFSIDYGDYNDSHEAFTLMNSVGKKKAKPIKVVNTRGKKSEVDWTYTLTKKDKATIKKFFYKKYKGKNPSRAEMAYYALEWINKKVDYDYAYKYGDLRYVDAIFNKKKGQCLQYNGAFAAVLTYLGYEARVIEGYRMDSSGKPTINHFWCEVKLNGRWYLCETGNYGKNGYWQYFASLYRNSNGYAKYGKLAKD